MARILVIEDNTPNLQLMVYLLRAFGHTPLEAVDGETGLELAHHKTPDLILCDIHLPGVDGFEVARRLKSTPALATIPLVAVTALAMVGDRERVLAAGFEGYIGKPITPETFVSQAEKFLPPELRMPERPKVVSQASGNSLPLPQKSGKILVVDNVRNNIELSRSILEASGYTVLTATSVQAALHLMQQTQPDLILSDLHMPEQSGFDLLRIVRNDSKLRHIKVAIQSATVMSKEDEKKAQELGATRFITRPIEAQTLLDEIEKCLK